MYKNKCLLFIYTLAIFVGTREMDERDFPYLNGSRLTDGHTQGPHQFSFGPGPSFSHGPDGGATLIPSEPFPVYGKNRSEMHHSHMHSGNDTVYPSLSFHENTSSIDQNDGEDTSWEINHTHKPSNNGNDGDDTSSDIYHTHDDMREFPPQFGHFNRMFSTKNYKGEWEFSEDCMKFTLKAIQRMEREIGEITDVDKKQVALVIYDATYTTYDDAEVYVAFLNTLRKLEGNFDILHINIGREDLSADRWYDYLYQTNQESRVRTISIHQETRDDHHGSILSHRETKWPPFPDPIGFPDDDEDFTKLTFYHAIDELFRNIRHHLYQHRHVMLTLQAPNGDGFDHLAISLFNEFQRHIENNRLRIQLIDRNNVITYTNECHFPKIVAQMRRIFREDDDEANIECTTPELIYDRVNPNKTPKQYFEALFPDIQIDPPAAIDRSRHPIYRHLVNYKKHIKWSSKTPHRSTIVEVMQNVNPAHPVSQVHPSDIKYILVNENGEVQESDNDIHNHGDGHDDDDNDNDDNDNHVNNDNEHNSSGNGNVIGEDVNDHDNNIGGNVNDDGDDHDDMNGHNNHQQNDDTDQEQGMNAVADAVEDEKPVMQEIKDSSFVEAMKTIGDDYEFIGKWCQTFNPSQDDSCAFWEHISEVADKFSTLQRLEAEDMNDSSMSDVRKDRIVQMQSLKNDTDLIHDVLSYMHFLLSLKEQLSTQVNIVVIQLNFNQHTEPYSWVQQAKKKYPMSYFLMGRQLPEDKSKKVYKCLLPTVSVVNACPEFTAYLLKPFIDMIRKYVGDGNLVILTFHSLQNPWYMTHLYLKHEIPHPNFIVHVEIDSSINNIHGYVFSGPITVSTHLMTIFSTGKIREGSLMAQVDAVQDRITPHDNQTKQTTITVLERDSPQTGGSIWTHIIPEEWRKSLEAGPRTVQSADISQATIHGSLHNTQKQNTAPLSIPSVQLEMEGEIIRRRFHVKPIKETCSAQKISLS